MAQKGDLMTARSDIRVLDATIRDGGLVNNFMFSDDFINALYRTNVKAVSYTHLHDLHRSEIQRIYL